MQPYNRRKYDSYTTVAQCKYMKTGSRLGGEYTAGARDVQNTDVKDTEVLQVTVLFTSAFDKLPDTSV